ncbi:MAG: pentapeptide repeat-containing protein [Elainella sp.]
MAMDRATGWPDWRDEKADWLGAWLTVRFGEAVAMVWRICRSSASSLSIFPAAWEFWGAGLEGCRLDGSRLAGAGLAGVRLTGDEFTEVRFAEARFAEARFAEAKFPGARLTGIKLVVESAGGRLAIRAGCRLGRVRVASDRWAGWEVVNPGLVGAAVGDVELAAGLEIGWKVGTAVIRETRVAGRRSAAEATVVTLTSGARPVKSTCPAIRLLANWLPKAGRVWVVARASMSCWRLL